VGFWCRPEVVDLVNLLHALATESHVSLVGVLRSPLFGLPDDQVEGLVKGQWGLTLSGLGREKPLDGSAPGALVRAHHLWRILLDSRDSLPWPLLLRLAVEQLAVRHVVDLDEPGRGWPNVLQLLEHADQLAAGGGATILETGAERLMDLVREEHRETEAEPSAGEARVFLMTVHASKGLEFPVVVLPGMAILRLRTPSLFSPSASPENGTWLVGWRIRLEHCNPVWHLEPGMRCLNNELERRMPSVGACCTWGSHGLGTTSCCWEGGLASVETPGST